LKTYPEVTSRNKVICLLQDKLGVVTKDIMINDYRMVGWNNDPLEIINVVIFSERFEDRFMK